MKKEGLEGKIKMEMKMNLKKKMSLFGIALACSGTLATAGNVFADSATAQDTPVTAKITVDKLPETPNLPKPLPGNPDNDSTNNNNSKPVTSDAKVAFAYIPLAMTGSAAFTNSGAASVPLSVSDAQGGHASSVGHVGVKDQTKEKNSWKLQAAFTTADAELAGSNITLEDGKVQMNDKGNLTALANAEVTAVANPTLTAAPTDILSADNTKSQYGVYDYQFKNAKLNVADSSKVSAGDHTGTINWTLIDVPQP